MLQRLAHLFGLKKKDDVLAKRFAQLTARYANVEPVDSLDYSADFVTHIRAGLERQPVVGSCKLHKDFVRQAFLDTYARSVEVENGKQLVGAGSR